MPVGIRGNSQSPLRSFATALASCLVVTSVAWLWIGGLSAAWVHHVDWLRRLFTVPQPAAHARQPSSRQHRQRSHQRPRLCRVPA
jgi:hypothetical protein